MGAVVPAPPLLPPPPPAERRPTPPWTPSLSLPGLPERPYRITTELGERLQHLWRHAHHINAIRTDEVPLLDGEKIEGVYQDISFLCPFMVSGIELLIFSSPPYRRSLVFGPM